MRIQFVTVPGSEKVLLCISETQTSSPAAMLAGTETLKDGLGVGAVLITEEIVHFEPASPEDAPEVGAYHPCEYCLTRPGGLKVASQACDHA